MPAASSQHQQQLILLPEGLLLLHQGLQ